MGVNLKSFCSDEEFRSYLNRPWTRGEYTYASDGHILIRVAALAEYGDADRAPDATRIAVVPDGELTPIVWADFPKPPATIECEECEGAGSKAPCGCHCHQCICNSCRGEGTIQPPQFAALRGGQFNARFLRLVRMAGPVSTLSAVGRPAYFKGDGFEIWLSQRTEIEGEEIFQAEIRDELKGDANGE